MKVILALMMLILNCNNIASIDNNKNVSVTIKVDSTISTEPQWVYVYYYSCNDLYLDSVFLEKGQQEARFNMNLYEENRLVFLFEKKGPVQFSIIASPKDRIIADLSEEDGETAVQKNVIGSVANNDYVMKQNASRELNENIRNISSALMFPNITLEQEKEINTIVDSLNQQLIDLNIAATSTSKSATCVFGSLFYLRNKIPNAVIDSLARMAVKRFNTPNRSLSKLVGIVEDCPPINSKTDANNARLDYLQQKRLALFAHSAKMADNTSNFTVNNLSLPNDHGKIINVSEIKGKFILVDFWASWCVPCVAEMPLIVEAKKQYGDNLVICTISLDKSKQMWLSSLKRYHMNNFINLIALDKNDRIDKQIERLKIGAVPTNFLLNSDHEIIAKDLHGKTLINTLDSIMK